jgi:hypothetical protein
MPTSTISTWKLTPIQSTLRTRVTQPARSAPSPARRTCHRAPREPARSAARRPGPRPRHGRRRTTKDQPTGPGRAPTTRYLAPAVRGHGHQARGRAPRLPASSARHPRAAPGRPGPTARRDQGSRSRLTRPPLAASAPRARLPRRQDSGIPAIKDRATPARHRRTRRTRRNRTRRMKRRPRGGRQRPGQKAGRRDTSPRPAGQRLLRADQCRPVNGRDPCHPVKDRAIRGERVPDQATPAEPGQLRPGRAGPARARPARPATRGGQQPVDNRGPASTVRARPGLSKHRGQGKRPTVSGRHGRPVSRDLARESPGAGQPATGKVRSPPGQREPPSTVQGPAAAVASDRTSPRPGTSASRPGRRPTVRTRTAQRRLAPRPMVPASTQVLTRTGRRHQAAPRRLGPSARIRCVTPAPGRPPGRGLGTAGRQARPRPDPTLGARALGRPGRRRGRTGRRPSRRSVQACG